MLFDNDWDEILKDEILKDYFQNIIKFIDKEYEEKTIYPPRADIFNALKATAFSDVKVLLLGQDPYHGKGQAHGLCFSVQKGVEPPPSLKNIYKELASDLGFKIPNNGYLQKWTKEGVLLLNSVLTVREGEPNSHKACGWETFTDSIIKKLNEKEKSVIFLLWGANAKAKLPYVTGKQHYVLTAAHPSPLSAYNGFLGCKHFSKVNYILKNEGSSVIDWQLDNI